MAATTYQPQEIQKVVEGLERDITCPVCHDRFKEPKILPCLHYYCKQCIQALMGCPECRSDTTFPQTDPDHLPTAFFVNHMIDLHEKMEKAHGKVQAVCEQCSEAKAVAFCCQCAEFICDDCVNVHKKMKAFSGHKVTALEDLKDNMAIEMFTKDALAPACKVHDEQMKFYCCDCNVLICQSCVLCDHHIHKYEFVRATAPVIKQELAECLAPLREVQMRLRDANETIKSTKSDIGSQGVLVAANIEQSFQELHDILERHKRELLEKTSSLVKGKLDALRFQAKDIEAVSCKIQRLMEFVEMNIKYTTEEETMSIRTQVLNRIKDETRKHCRLSSDFEPVEGADIVMEVGCAEELRKLCHDKAIVVSSPADPAMSIVQGDGIKNAKVNKVSMLRLQAVSLHGKPQKKPVLVKAKLTPIVNRAIVQAEVRERTSGTYEIEYSPTVRGHHQLEVTVNGLPVAGSPFPVFVKVPATQLGQTMNIYHRLKGVGVAVTSKDELVFAEHAGDIVFLDRAGNRLRSIKKSQHGFQKLFGVAVDDNDNIYATDAGLKCVFKFNKHGTKTKSVTPAVSNFNPRGVAVSNNQVIVADYYNHQLLYFTRGLSLKASVVMRGNTPCGVACDRDGMVYFCDHEGACVKVLSPQDKLLYIFGTQTGAHKPQYKMTEPHSICVDGDFVYISEWGSKHCVSVFTKEGKFITSFGTKGDEVQQFNLPGGLAIDSEGIVYVCDFNNSRLQAF